MRFPARRRPSPIRSGSFVRQRLYGADDHAVGEIVVETMYEVWMAADRFASQSQVKTWVLGIARHKLMLAEQFFSRETLYFVVSALATGTYSLLIAIS